MRFGTFKTVKGVTVIITNYYPKVNEYLGYLMEKGKKVESLWDKEGKNLEEPDWDLVLTKEEHNRQ